MNDKIMDYLKVAEGDYIHKNRRESDITSAYGIYRKRHPKAEIFKWYDKIAKEHGISRNFYVKANRVKLNALISKVKAYKSMERVLAWSFYEKYFMNSLINSILSEKEELTFLSLSVNGGRKRGIKALQHALSKLHTPLRVDGKFGHYSMTALIDYHTSDEYKEDNLNAGMLNYMRGFYAYLIKVNPRKYARNKDGWENRLTALA